MMIIDYVQINSMSLNEVLKKTKVTKEMFEKMI